MKREDLYDLAAFSVVAEERSFTRAAARLGLSQSALSHAITALEKRLGMRLLSRTTRSVAATSAGAELLQSLLPALQAIEAGLEVLQSKRSQASGTVRLTMVKHAANSILQPMLPAFRSAYPDIEIEIVIDDGYTDIVAGRFDAGIRLGERVAKDMVALRIGPDIRTAVVASPDYLARHPAPLTPQDLMGHCCINYRLASSGKIFAWQFEDAGHAFELRVNGALVFNNGDLIEEAAIDGLGVAYLFEDQIDSHLASGRLVRLLDGWSKTFQGYYIYYPSRRQTPPALAALVEALRSRIA